MTTPITESSTNSTKTVPNDDYLNTFKQKTKTFVQDWASKKDPEKYELELRFGTSGNSFDAKINQTVFQSLLSYVKKTKRFIPFSKKQMTDIRFPKNFRLTKTKTLESKTNTTDPSIFESEIKIQHQAENFLIKRANHQARLSFNIEVENISFSFKQPELIRYKNRESFIYFPFLVEFSAIKSFCFVNGEERVDDTIEYEFEVEWINPKIWNLLPSNLNEQSWTQTIKGNLDKHVDSFVGLFKKFVIIIIEASSIIEKEMIPIPFDKKSKEELSKKKFLQFATPKPPQTKKLSLEQARETLTIKDDLPVISIPKTPKTVPVIPQSNFLMHNKRDAIEHHITTEKAKAEKQTKRQKKSNTSIFDQNLKKQAPIFDFKEDEPMAPAEIKGGSMINLGELNNFDPFK